MYNVEFAPSAVAGAMMVRRSDSQAYKKLCGIVEELQKHPLFGSGRPEALRGKFTGLWSRKVSRRHRILYSVEGDTVKVAVVGTSWVLLK